MFLLRVCPKLVDATGHNQAAASFCRARRRAGSGASLQLGEAFPAQLEISRIFFMTPRTKNRRLCAHRTLHPAHHFQRLPDFALIRYPYFRPSLVDRNFSHDALQIFVQYHRIDASVTKQVAHQMGLDQCGGRIDFFHPKPDKRERTR